MTYDQYLQSEQWRELKDNIQTYHSDEFGKCYVCGTEKDIQLHHKRYTKIFAPIGKHRLSVVALCSHCHFEVHKLAIKKKDWGLRHAVAKYKKMFNKLQAFREAQAKEGIFQHSN